MHKCRQIFTWYTAIVPHVKSNERIVNKYKTIAIAIAIKYTNTQAHTHFIAFTIKFSVETHFDSQYTYVHSHDDGHFHFHATLLVYYIVPCVLLIFWLFSCCHRVIDWHWRRWLQHSRNDQEACIPESEISKTHTHSEFHLEHFIVSTWYATEYPHKMFYDCFNKLLLLNCWCRSRIVQTWAVVHMMQWSDFFSGDKLNGKFLAFS